MATYNGEKFIFEQLKSILEQLGEMDEVVISDDSSNDNTLDIIKSFKDERIKLLEGQRFRDPLLNFEYALLHAKHDIIFLSDQDDVWLSNKVNIMIHELEKFDLVVCDHSVIDESRNILLDSYFCRFPFRSKTGLLRNLYRNSYLGCCMAFRRAVLEKALPFPKKVQWHDWWLGLTGELFFRTKFIPSVLTLYRAHSNNLTFGSSLKSKNSFFCKLSFRINLISNLHILLLKK
jgi:glycosyltransferase involved in cell wall biosynthesis